MHTAAGLVVTLALLSISPCAAAARQPIPESCPITAPGEASFTPHNSESVLARGFWHGDERLAVYLNPGASLFRQKQRQKMMWYRKAYSWRDDRPIAPLRITGRRLDSAGDASPHIEGPNNASLAKGFTVMMNIVVFPEPGCWQLEGNYEGDYLAFVVWVD
jgi:hypothetical protein